MIWNTIFLIKKCKHLGVDTVDGQGEHRSFDAVLSHLQMDLWTDVCVVRYLPRSTDVTAWKSELPGGTISMLHLRARYFPRLEGAGPLRDISLTFRTSRINWTKKETIVFTSAWICTRGEPSLWTWENYVYFWVQIVWQKKFNFVCGFYGIKTHHFPYGTLYFLSFLGFNMLI